MEMQWQSLPTTPLKSRDGNEMQNSVNEKWFSVFFLTREPFCEGTFPIYRDQAVAVAGQPAQPPPVWQGVAGSLDFTGSAFAAPSEALE